MRTNIQAIYAKLARKETVSEEEVVALLEDLEHYQQATAYLASCQAATVESLPKSTPKSTKARHESICKTAAQLLDGDRQGIRYQANAKVARKRCLDAIDDSQAESCKSK